MDRPILTAVGVAALFFTAAPASHGVAMTPGAPAELAAPGDARSARMAQFICDRKCARRWPPRQYWQWDQPPLWGDPGTLLQPNIWGSAEPGLVPADPWAQKWHPPWIRYWHARHPHRKPTATRTEKTNA